MQSGAAGASEVAEFRIHRPEFVLEMIHELGNERIQIGVAMPMPVRGKVERHRLEACLEVRAVIEVEAAHDHLIGFAVATMLGEDHARHRFE